MAENNTLIYVLQYSHLKNDLSRVKRTPHLFSVDFSQFGLYTGKPVNNSR